MQQMMPSLYDDDEDEEVGGIIAAKEDPDVCEQ